VEDVRRRPARRVATLSATVAFTAKLLVPRAASFRALNPGWDLRLHACDDLVDLHTGEADAAIRYGLGPYSGLEATPLLTDNFAPVCSPHLPVDHVEALLDATLIHFDWRSDTLKQSIPTWARWAEKAGLKGLDSEAGLSFNDENSAIQAAIAGQGVALLSLTLVAAELASGSLIQPFGPPLEGLRYDFVYPTGAESRPAIMVLQKWVSAEFPETMGSAQVAKSHQPAHL
jgi:LysR family glycine cleavage system transcriptional activator